MNDQITNMKGKIQNIIFDFGGVLLDLYPERTFSQLTDLLGVNFGPDMVPQDLMDTFIKYEIGEVRDERLLWNLQHIAKTKPQPREVINAWNAMLGGWNLKKFESLKKANELFDIYLLSNTNHLHLEWVYRDLRSNHDITDFDSRFFCKTYYSHLIGLRKPDPKIFEFVLLDSNLDPHSTLFIDDNKDNVEAAKSVGLQAILHPANSSVDYIFDLID